MQHSTRHDSCLIVNRPDDLYTARDFACVINSTLQSCSHHLDVLSLNQRLVRGSSAVQEPECGLASRIARRMAQQRRRALQGEKLAESL